MDYENIIYFIPTNGQFHLLGLFKDKHLEKLKISNIILWLSLIVSEGFSNNSITTTS